MSALLDQVESDLDCFLNVEEWAQTASLTIAYEAPITYNEEIPYNGGSDSIPVVFEEAADVVSPIDNETVTTQPMAWGKTSDLTSISRGSQLSIGGTSYWVQSIQKDGMGISAMILSRKATN